MSFWYKIHYNLLYLAIKFLVKSKLIPPDPIKDLNLDTTHSFLYVLPYYSKTDLLTLRQQCFSIGLPDPLHPITINKIKLPACLFIDDKPKIFRYYTSNQKKSIKTFIAYLDLHFHNPELNIQLLPVSVMFGRAPGREAHFKKSSLHFLHGIQKFLSIIWLGRDSFVQFSPSIFLRKMVYEHGNDKFIVKKLIRVARIYYLRQRLAAVGPKLPIKNNLFDKLLKLKIIEKSIEDEAKIKRISLKKAKKNAINIMEEIAANFSYEAIRITDRILSWTWNRLYQGITVQHAERVRQLAQDVNEIVYIPCHRSHMDYLLLSYVLYHQGLVPPHIAAGSNLNFWPIGQIFRHLGAFFIRRSFNGNKLYSNIFREYLSELFSRGYSIEYFIEGGRSRTGRLLAPKTGTLSMTIQAMLREDIHPITIVPIYIGYDHVLEVGSYIKELQGAKKEKENLFTIFKSLFKLRKLGKSYVNFGQPIKLKNYLNKFIPKWHQSSNIIQTQRPIWLNSAVTKLAHNIMVSINNATAVNSINLCATALLASKEGVLTKKQLLKQIQFYLELFKNVPYSNESTMPKNTADFLVDEALKLKKIIIEKNKIDDIILIPKKNIVIMTYYRNNITHLLILPALLANIILHNNHIHLNEIYRQIKLVYPFVKAEFFIKYNLEELSDIIEILIDELIRQQLIFKNKDCININKKNIFTLQLLAANIKEILARYAITLALLNKTHKISRTILEKETYILAKYISILHGINTLEFFDKISFSTLLNTLKKQGYINKEGNMIIILNSKLIYHIIIKLISTAVRFTIESVNKISNNTL
ncbi:glycerol-3-phosphate 1-O-acyltransferase PlsB [Arsenophonus symbiont of Ornithomya chloropus]|uniref:glycerol-3-phosphate 1-O-acyltransferase PlsB n=1 Tax=Arsenophonus symbiont of Ornithomya chloropus TaxID=634121 RepID=UPI0032B0F7D9